MINHSHPVNFRHAIHAPEMIYTCGRQEYVPKRPTMLFKLTVVSAASPINKAIYHGCEAPHHIITQCKPQLKYKTIHLVTNCPTRLHERQWIDVCHKTLSYHFRWETISASAGLTKTSVGRCRWKPMKLWFRNLMNLSLSPLAPPSNTLKKGRL